MKCHNGDVTTVGILTDRFNAIFIHYSELLAEFLQASSEFKNEVFLHFGSVFSVHF